MTLENKYQPNISEIQLVDFWQRQGVYQFNLDDPRPVYSIDTPPPTVSGHLHLGHVYSYSHADFMARYFRMNGYNVFYPMGFDDNGLPTERLVEKRQKITAQKVGRQAFIQACLAESETAEKDYQELWQRLGLSIDWRYSYRTIDENSRRISQKSFLDLYEQGLVYQKLAPAIWCPECKTSIAQADLNDFDRESEFITLQFTLPDRTSLYIATTRPELLAACVAVFVHPEDKRYQNLIGLNAQVPLYNQLVPILADPAAEPEKGTGAVMCCTFGDQTDVIWWASHNLPLVEAVDRQGHMTDMTRELAGLTIIEARRQVKDMLGVAKLIFDRQPTSQSIRVHERCDTTIEYVVARQWFVRVLDHKEEFLKAGQNVTWHPGHMHNRYQSWVENLNWDWCISRQRFFGVPFPVWFCKECGAISVAKEDQLPVDPLSQNPAQPCHACGGQTFLPEQDVMDTWATSSLSPQIVGQQLTNPKLFARVFPFSLRPQAHEIIRTWAFYTIAKSHYHQGQIPWKATLISGWGLAGEGMGKISKSRGGGPMPPLEMIQRYSADAVRYWAASTSPGKDSVISEEKFLSGSKLVTKLWNVAKFTSAFLAGAKPVEDPAAFTTADKWILASLQNLIEHCTSSFEEYEYSTAKGDVESFFWRELADNYVEMAKLRLYSPAAPGHGGATFTLYTVLETVLKLLAPFLPYVTDTIYREMFAAQGGEQSIHTSRWPSVLPAFRDPQALLHGELLITAASAIRRYKSEKNLSLGTELIRVQLAPDSPALAKALFAATGDIMSVTRAREVEVTSHLNPGLTELEIGNEHLKIAIE